MGNVSRESRLCFILLFTVADDHGKLRGNSRMLASLLYPYDDDAPKLIEKWLTQLEKEKCIVRYECDGAHYIKILNWESHQKVDSPSPSKIPDPRESSRVEHDTSRSLTVGSEDQGSEDQGKDQRKGSGSASIDYELLIQIWNDTAGELCPRVEKLIDSRKQSMRLRLADSFDGSIDRWREYCVLIRSSPFLTGSNDRGWRADFDWALKQPNIAKTLEGKYANSSPRNKHSAFDKQDYLAGTDGFLVTGGKTGG